MKPISLSFLADLSRSTNAQEAAVADNCRFDERTHADRWAKFEGKLPETDSLAWGDWGEANKSNVESVVEVASITVPDAFLEINRQAWLAGIVANRDVVRLELIQRALGGGIDTVDALQTQLDRANAGDKDAGNSLDKFFNSWDSRRDGRPTFAAFYDEVKAEYEDADWPHALRDRLGLGHYGKEGGSPLAVALMRYSLEEVIAEQINRKLPVACALPTVLDGGMHEFFFPVPRQHPYGATLHLDPDKADWLTAEILHCRIQYQRRHLQKLGWIVRGHGVRDDALRGARDLHLLSLREACGRDDFGEAMEKRT